MNNLNVKITYLSNFKPNTSVAKNFNFNYKNKIISKNFILFIFFLKNSFKKKNVSLFIKPYKHSNLTILRSPYRHKLTRHQLTFNRFYLDVNLTFPLKNFLNVDSNNEIFNIVNDLNNFLHSFETNVCNQHKIQVIFNFNNNNFFNLNKYNNNLH